MEEGKVYTYKGRYYIIVRCKNVMAKDPDDGNWYPAVTYRPAEETDKSVLYVRRFEDFAVKFKPHA